MNTQRREREEGQAGIVGSLDRDETSFGSVHAYGVNFISTLFFKIWPKGVERELSLDFSACCTDSVWLYTYDVLLMEIIAPSSYHNSRTEPLPT